MSPRQRYVIDTFTRFAGAVLFSWAIIAFAFIVVYWGLM